ncbi:MAG: sugar ABC transporter ATP-binding protein [Lachnospiraceae bacterium]|nr:sugar ABC transporter ATP-binding protein [Lachnospiraceae bacterium]
MSETILELKNIGKTFNGVNVLRGVNLELHKGEVLALMGENGAGKSTLIKVVAGYHQPDPGGEMYVEGKLVKFNKPKDAMKAHIHTIYQELTLCPDMTVAENIVIDKQDEYKGFFTRNGEYRKLAKEVLEKLGQPINPDITVRQLSIAKQQVVEIAKAISSEAKILIMDEPTSSLSEKDANLLLQMVLDLRNQGVAIIYISHRMNEIFKIADRICVLRDGSYIDTVNAADITREQLIGMMVGRTLDNAYPKAHVELGKTVLKVENLETDAFKDVSFEVREGEICGIGGLVGAKRTEILDTLFGMKEIKGGTIEIFGEQFKPKNQKDAIKKGMAYVTEDRKKNGVVLCLSVTENINMVNAAEITSHKGFLNKGKIRKIAEKNRDALNIRLASLDQTASSLSGGNMQKLVIAKWMDMDPKIILFDEPTRGIDIGAKAEIYSIMAEFVKKGTAIIMVSSELPELISVSDKIVVMCEGRMTGIIDHKDATQEKVMEMATYKKEGTVA